MCVLTKGSTLYFGYAILRNIQTEIEEKEKETEAQIRLIDAETRRINAETRKEKAKAGPKLTDEEMKDKIVTHFTQNITPNVTHLAQELA